MAKEHLDAIVFKTVEHQPRLIKDCLIPPYYNQHGTTSLNTFLIHAAAMNVPAGFTEQNLPVGITIFGPSFSEPTLLKLAYSYEQATHHRIPPPTVPALKALPETWAELSHNGELSNQSSIQPMVATVVDLSVNKILLSAFLCLQSKFSKPILGRRAMRSYEGLSKNFLF